MVLIGQFLHDNWSIKKTNEKWRVQKDIIDFDRLMGLLGFENYDDLKEAHYKWVEGEIESNNCDKEDKWTQKLTNCKESHEKRLTHFC